MMQLYLHASHDGSITICDKEEVIVHTQIDRFNKLKSYLPYPSKILVKKLKEINIDKAYLTTLSFGISDAWEHLLNDEKICPYKNVKKNDNKQHHDFHSNTLDTFNYAKNKIIADGRGARLPTGEYEFLSIISNGIKSIYINENTHGLGMAYENMTISSGFKGINNEGKLMALSTYGKYNDDFAKEIWKNGFYVKEKDLKKYLDKEGIILNDDKNNFDAHNFIHTFQKLCEWRFREVVKENNLKDELSLSGGFALNIINNTNLLKDFKVNVDPFNNDSGISLGAANYINNQKIKLNTVYLGFKPEYHDIPRNFELKKVDVAEVAKILMKEPLGIYQGRSEQGQRGLGNRSLLINPLLKDAKEKINTVKKREWYRPFAATILSESLDKYFFDHGADGSYMLFTYKVKEQYKNLLKNIISNENNCRLQVLKEYQNSNYYKLIKTFSDLSGHPIVLNTSLNLPGETLVETLDDLTEMMNNCNLKYSYLPDINSLLIKHG